MTASERPSWGSRIGFILAASGSAIGLGNIVFFSASAYQYGGGAFYIPYLIALVLVGLPVLTLEFGLGRLTGGAFPLSMRSLGGRAGEFVGWWGIANAMAITMYYITLLGWVLGMGVRAATGSLWAESVPVEGFGMEAGVLPNPTASFFDMISGWGVLGAVLVVWLINIALVVKGASTIEKGVRIMMPLLWVIMGGLAILAMFLPGGTDGAWLLLTPRFGALDELAVWKGAFSQIFFTLSLGFGVMSAYASYLPRESDDVANSAAVAGLNCLFELVAGIAVFGMLASFALTPKASTLAMMFFIVPVGIAQLPFLVTAFGVLFFALLLMAGITSSISLIEAAISAAIDKFGWKRTPVVVVTSAFGIVGSIAFALPVVIDPTLDQNGTLGLTLLDYVDHYANGYGLMLTGLVECILIGWFLPIDRMRAAINETSRFRLGTWFNALVKFVIPAILAFLLIAGLWQEVRGGAVYGSREGVPSAWPLVALLAWAAFTLGTAAIMTLLPGRERADGGAL